MKTSGQILQELGFNKNSSESAKAAFLQHLIKAATGYKVKAPNFENKLCKAPPATQLSFEFDSGSYQEAI